MFVGPCRVPSIRRAQDAFPQHTLRLMTLLSGEGEVTFAAKENARNARVTRARQIIRPSGRLSFHRCRVANRRAGCLASGDKLICPLKSEDEANLRSQLLRCIDSGIPKLKAQEPELLD